jgi:hypothetical protein
MEWNGMEWNGMEWNGMEWNGTEWNGYGMGMEWKGMEWEWEWEWNGWKAAHLRLAVLHSDHEGADVVHQHLVAARGVKR